MRPRALIAAIVLATALSVATAASTTAANATAAGSSTPAYGDIVSDFICVSCHEPLELVNSPQALSEKAYLGSLVNRGLSYDEIKRAMVAQYGVAVLARPPAHGFNLTVYILPPLVLLCGVGLLLYTLPKWRARARAAAARPAGAGGPPLDPGDASRLDDELDRLV